jgi:hypothetical protein
MVRLGKMGASFPVGGLVSSSSLGEADIMVPTLVREVVVDPIPLGKDLA